MNYKINAEFIGNMLGALLRFINDKLNKLWEDLTAHEKLSSVISKNFLILE